MSLQASAVILNEEDGSKLKITHTNLNVPSLFYNSVLNLL